MAIGSGAGVGISFSGLTATVLEVRDRESSVAILDVTPLSATQKKFRPGGVRDNGELVVTAGYEPALNQIPQCGSEANITVTYPDTSSDVFEAFVQKIGRPRLHGDERMVVDITFKLGTES